jgi:hypothetical protein
VAAGDICGISGNYGGNITEIIDGLDSIMGRIFGGEPQPKQTIRIRINNKILGKLVAGEWVMFRASGVTIRLDWE